MNAPSHPDAGFFTPDQAVEPPPSNAVDFSFLYGCEAFNPDPRTVVVREASTFLAARIAPAIWLNMTEARERNLLHNNEKGLHDMLLQLLQFELTRRCAPPPLKRVRRKPARSKATSSIDSWWVRFEKSMNS